MKNTIVILLASIIFLTCKAQEEPTRFSKAALDDTFLNLDGTSITLNTILKSYKGKTILIDVWASWCRDCIVGLPNLKAIQKEYTNVTYVFLSMDKTQSSWKNGIKKYDMNGEHYFMPSGWDSAFSDFVDLDWVPRYMVVDENSSITLFRAIKVNDPKIKELLK